MNTFEEHGYIYLNKLYVNGLLHTVYVGFHKYDKKEIDKHYWGSGKVWKKKLNCYGRKNVERTMIDWYDSIDERDLKEKFWISFYIDKYKDILDKYGHSICVNDASGGGSGGDMLKYKTEEERQRIIKKRAETSKNKSADEKRKIEAKRKKTYESYTEQEILEINRKKANYGENNFSTGKNFKLIKKDDVCKKVQTFEVDDFLNDGWVFGNNTNYNTGENHHNFGKDGYCKDRNWYNNGIVELELFECPDGFVRGRLNNFGENNPNYGNHKLAGENHFNYGKELKEDTKSRISKTLWKHPSVYMRDVETFDILMEFDNSRDAINWLNEHILNKKAKEQPITQCCLDPVDHSHSKNRYKIKYGFCWTFSDYIETEE